MGQNVLLDKTFTIVSAIPKYKQVRFVVGRCVNVHNLRWINYKCQYRWETDLKLFNDNVRNTFFFTKRAPF